MDGLQARLAVPQTEVPLGSRVDFQLHFGFDPKDVDAKLNLLNYGDAAWEAELVFRDTKSDNVFRRRPFDIGMLRVTWPKDVAELRRGSLRPQGLRIHLLNDAGEQIPPGTYRVTALYKNTAQPELEFWTDEDGNLGSRPYAGPWTFWKGTVTSAPITLTITPAESEEIELTINSALVITRGKDGDRDTIGWTWSQDEPKTVKAKHRPGYVIGKRYVLHVFLDGRDIGQVASGLGGGAWDGGEGMSFLEPQIVKRVLAGASLDYRPTSRCSRPPCPAGIFGCRKLATSTSSGKVASRASWSARRMAASSRPRHLTEGLKPLRRVGKPPSWDAPRMGGRGRQ